MTWISSYFNNNRVKNKNSRECYSETGTKGLQLLGQLNHLASHLHHLRHVMAGDEPMDREVHHLPH